MPSWLEEIAGPNFAPAVLWTLLALVVLVIVLVIVRIVRSMTFGTFVVGGRNRKTRLAIMDAAAVDSQRRLVLVRRDDIEHLILIGGPTDVVVERDIRLHASTRRPGPQAEAAPDQQRHGSVRQNRRRSARPEQRRAPPAPVRPINARYSSTARKGAGPVGKQATARTAVDGISRSQTSRRRARRPPRRSLPRRQDRDFRSAECRIRGGQDEAEASRNLARGGDEPPARRAFEKK